MENEEVWNSGRPKRACNRPRISADERLVVDNKSYYKVEVLPSKLRSGQVPFDHEMYKRPHTPLKDVTDDDKNFKCTRKMRNSELIRLNNEAENFLFPKKDDSGSEEDEDDEEKSNDINSISGESEDFKRVNIEDDESMHSTGSESKQGKRRRRTHAEAFIMDNEKYYKFETPGSRLRYQGSYLSPLPNKMKNNGDCFVKTEQRKEEKSDSSQSFKIDLEKYQFSFESVPKTESWYQTFQRRDKGQEKYLFLGDDSKSFVFGSVDLNGMIV